MGGTFDPIHYGHLLAAERAREEFSLAEVVFVPCGAPPHKPEGCEASAEDRHRMTVLATEGNPNFSVSRREVERPGPSYSVATVEEFKTERGPDWDIFFITGVDAVRDLLTWKDPDRLLQLCRFIAVTRPGFQPQELEARLGVDRFRRIYLLPVAGVMVSSTEVRDRARRGLSLRYLTPAAVCEYIVAQQLYLNQV
jgi:nicotinate-nucleotide adenylyltransferase